MAVKNVYITTIQLYYLKKLIINLKLPDARIIKSISGGRRNRIFFKKRQILISRTLEASSESYNTLVKERIPVKKKVNTNISVLRECGTEGLGSALLH